jgi:hypothetical protein
MRAAFIVFSCVAVSGCFDVAIGAEVAVACSADVDCPATLQCVALRCIDPSTRDVRPPSLTSTEVSSPTVRGGDVLRARFAFDEPLRELPLVRGEGAVQQHIFSVAVVEGGYTADFEVGPDSVDGVYELFAQVVDASDNGARAFLEARYVVDNTAPVVNEVIAFPSRLRSDREVSVRITVRDPDLGDRLPTVELVREEDGLRIVADEIESAGASVVATLHVPPGGAGSYSAHVADLSDAVGNQLDEALVVEGVLLVDDDVPGLLSEITGAVLVGGQF